MHTATTTIGFSEEDGITEQPATSEEGSDFTTTTTEDPTIDQEGKEAVTDLSLSIDEKETTTVTTTTTEEADETTLPEDVGEDDESINISPVDQTPPPPQELDLSEAACEGHVCRNGGTCYTGITGRFQHFYYHYYYYARCIVFAIIVPRPSLV